MSAFTAYGYVSNVTRPEGATLELITGRGTQLDLLRKGRVSSPEAVRGSTAVGEGDVISTGRDTEANVGLFDGTQIHLYFSTTLTLSELRTSRFFSHDKQIKVVISPNEAEGTAAQAVFSTADMGGYTGASYKVYTPHAEVEVAPDSSVRVQIDQESSPAQTRVVVNRGSATVMAAGRRTLIGPGLMSVVSAGGAPSQAQPPVQNLVRNGDFTERPTSGLETVDGGGLDTAAWLPIRGRTGEDVPDGGRVALTSEPVGGQQVNAVVLEKTASGEPDERYVTVGIRQEINAPASFLRSIELRAAVKVVFQTEPVGGPQGEVFPVTIRVLYTDSRGQQKDWRYSFYICQSGSCSMRDATQVTLASWSTPEERANRQPPEPPLVLKQLDGPTPIGQDIDVINAIEIYAIGNVFHSRISDISLLGR